MSLGWDKWLFKLSSDSDVQRIFKIRYLLNCIVKFYSFKRSYPTQCFNRKRFSHVSSNCNTPTRCVKYGGAHGHARVDCISPSGHGYRYRDTFLGMYEGSKRALGRNVLSCIRRICGLAEELQHDDDKAASLIGVLLTFGRNG